jgi:hypothetical protein
MEIDLMMKYPIPYLGIATLREGGYSWSSISASIKRNNSVTILTAIITVRGVRTILGLIVASIIKYIVMPVNRYG